MTEMEKEVMWELRYESVEQSDADWPPDREIERDCGSLLEAMMRWAFTLNTEQMKLFDTVQEYNEEVLNFMRRRYFVLGYQKGQADAEQLKTAGTE